jgi:hypothetical protein
VSAITSDVFMTNASPDFKMEMQAPLSTGRRIYNCNRNRIDPCKSDNFPGCAYTYREVLIDLLNA